MASSFYHYYGYAYDPSYLQHDGKKGMRWGVRKSARLVTLEDKQSGGYSNALAKLAAVKVNNDSDENSESDSGSSYKEKMSEKMQKRSEKMEKGEALKQKREENQKKKANFKEMASRRADMKKSIKADMRKKELLKKSPRSISRWR